jgi:hypothetical protein
MYKTQIRLIERNLLGIQGAWIGKKSLCLHGGSQAKAAP